MTSSDKQPLNGTRSSWRVRQFIYIMAPGILVGMLVLGPGACKKDALPKEVQGASAEATTKRSADTAKATQPVDDDPLTIIASIPAEDAYRFFSGHIKNNSNNPAIWLDRDKHELVICGRGSLSSSRKPVLERFPATKQKEALDAYHALLVHAGYQPAGAPQKKPQTGHVLVAMDDLLPSSSHATKVFSSKQYDAIRSIVSLPRFS